MNNQIPIIYLVINWCTKGMSNQTFESPVLPLDNNRTNDDKESQITTTRKRRSRKQKQGI